MVNFSAARQHRRECLNQLHLSRHLETGGDDLRVTEALLKTDRVTPRISILDLRDVVAVYTDVQVDHPVPVIVGVSVASKAHARE